jgi:Trk K+ transport system NAD-binding subunit
MTIIIAAPVNMRAGRIYSRLQATVKKLETESLLPEDELPDLGDAKIAVVGMGQLGTGVYDTLAPRYGYLLVGFDSEPDIVSGHEKAGRNVMCVDATDDEMWERLAGTPIEVGILALKRHQENLRVVNRVLKRNHNAKIFAVARHADEVAELKEAGAEGVWNMYSEAGSGLASEVISFYKNKNADTGH